MLSYIGTDRTADMHTRILAINNIIFIYLLKLSSFQFSPNIVLHRSQVSVAQDEGILLI